MKKRRRPRPSLLDRFCEKYGPAILKVCRFIDKQLHPFFEGLVCVITFGEYRPRPYQEPKDIGENDGLPSYKKHQSSVGGLRGDVQAIMGDMHRVSRDISKAVRKMEHENPEVANAIQEVRNSPEYQQQVRTVQQKMAAVQERCNHIRQVCSYPTTVGSGNSSQNERQE